MDHNPRNRSHKTPLVSIVIATHERSAELDRTLSAIGECGLDRTDYEIIIVDNASRDETAEVVNGRVDRFIPLRRNLGSCAKDEGVRVAAGRYILFLDDDSTPRTGAIERMIHHFESQPRLGAAGFKVHLPDGQLEGAALPDVFLGCGVGFRAEALREAGGLDRSFFMQAEEYDLSFRLVGCGWAVRMFDDLHVDHRKTPSARRVERTTYYDIRNNLRVAARYLPDPYHAVYRRDWIERYAWLAQRDGHASAFSRGARVGRLLGVWERVRYRRRRMSPAAFEHFFRFRFVHRRMAELASGGVRRIVMADLGKNAYVFHRAAQQVGIAIAAIGDDRFAAPGRCYRGIPIVSLDNAVAREHDAVVVSNCAGVFAVVTAKRVGGMTKRTVHAWFGGPQTLGESSDVPADTIVCTGVTASAPIPRLATPVQA